MKKLIVFITSFTRLETTVLVVSIIVLTMSIFSITDLFNGPDKERTSAISTNQGGAIPKPLNDNDSHTGLSGTFDRVGIPEIDHAGSPKMKEDANTKMEDHRQKAPKQYTGQRNNRIITVKKDSPETMDSDEAREELDTMFEAFLEERGLSYENEMAAATGYSSSHQVNAPDNNDPGTHNAPPDQGGKEYSDTEIELMESYGLEDIKFTGTGELWIKLDSNNMSEGAVNEMMAEAANLPRDGTGPLKVVVWQGRRPAAIQTFFGEPIF